MTVVIHKVSFIDGTSNVECSCGYRFAATSGRLPGLARRVAYAHLANPDADRDEIVVTVHAKASS